MAKGNDSLKDRLSRYREITISVTGRKSGRSISNPVWFVLEGDKLYLLPVKGSDTQWYQNVLKNPTLRIEARGAEAEVKAVTITDAKTSAAGDREVSREVRSRGRERILFEVRCGRCRADGLIAVITDGEGS